MDQSTAPVFEETLVVPHPATFGEVKVIDRTPWRLSDDPRDPNPKSKAKVQCRVVEIETYDDYGEVISSVPAIKHQGYDTKAKKWHTDLAVSELRADRYMTEKKADGNDVPGLKQRFASAIAEYEQYLVKEGRDLHIVLLADQVYPEAINALICRGVKTVNALATLSDAELGEIKAALERSKFTRMAGLVTKFREKAQGKLKALGVGADTRPTRKAA
jgi:hypothetical protein